MSFINKFNINGKNIDIIDSNLSTSNINSSTIDFAIEDDSGNILCLWKDGHIRTQNFDSSIILKTIDDIKNDKGVSTNLTLNNVLKGKTGVWLGTSIPAQGYPQLVGNYLEMTITNESVGSSSCRIGMQTYSTNPLSDDYLGIRGIAWQNFFYSLSASQEEKYYVMECWTSTGRKSKLKQTINASTGEYYTDNDVSTVKGFVSLLGGNFYGSATDPTADSGDEPADWLSNDSSTKKSYALKCSYNTSSISGSTIEGKIDKYLTEDKFPDVWFFDHAHNDAHSETPDEMSEIPDDFYNRNYYIGSANFIFNRILSYKSTAKIILIGHYTKGFKGTGSPLSCYSAMNKLRDIWGFPLIESYNVMPFSSDSLIRTNGYWDTTKWNETGFTLTEDSSTDMGSSTMSKINNYWYYKIDGKVYKSNNQAIQYYEPRFLPIQDNGTWYQQISLKQRYFSDDLHPGNSYAKDLYARILANEILKQFLITTF